MFVGKYILLQVNLEKKKYYTTNAITETVMSCLNSIYKSNHCTLITFKLTYIRLLE